LVISFVSKSSRLKCAPQVDIGVIKLVK
jgi:hypothetical protein